ncbi:MAG: recombinase family protein [Candidatus Heimdallarchaeota archaeon]|nr:recombinase family protein [Candidatus Heimdallarchaeota archaeon]MCK4954413.1 recombinase family protein [Candidatus Heimdallarchaeota archaeon]
MNLEDRQKELLKERLKEKLEESLEENKKEIIETVLESQKTVEQAQLEDRKNIETQPFRTTVNVKNVDFFGYYNDKGKIRINEEEAKTVRLIFSWYFKRNEDLGKISDRTQKSISDIKEIISNPFYFGKIIEDGKVKKGKHKPIIDKSYRRICNINENEIIEKYLLSLREI